MLVFLIFKEALINVLRFLCKIWFKNGSEKAQITFYFRATATAPFFLLLLAPPRHWRELKKVKVAQVPSTAIHQCPLTPHAQDETKSFFQQEDLGIKWCVIIYLDCTFM